MADAVRIETTNIFIMVTNFESLQTPEGLDDFGNGRNAGKPSQTRGMPG
jgi:hypothetical protein